MAFTRRFDRFPTNEVLDAIEAINIVDVAPPVTQAVGSGRVLAVGETEDGPFAGPGASLDSPFYARQGQKHLQVFGGGDLVDKYGGFGFTYDGVPHENPSARLSGGEPWNGSLFIKLRNLRFGELAVARVDTSVGSIDFRPLGSVDELVSGNQVLTNGLELRGQIDGAAEASFGTVTAAAALVAGSGFGVTVDADAIGVSINGGPVIVVGFGAATAVADVITEINDAVGPGTAVLNGGEVDITSAPDDSIVGTGASVVLSDIVAGSLARIGHAAGATAGTGNVVNVQAVTPAERASIYGGTSGISATVIDGRVRISSDTPGTGSVAITAGALAVTFPSGVFEGGVHAGGEILAGTRVRASGGGEWVTMQTLTVPGGDALAPSQGPWPVKVRPALDDGTAKSETAGAVTIVVDMPIFSSITCINAEDLTDALTDVLKDDRYAAALTSTLAIKPPVRTANFLLSARYSATLLPAGRQNALDASNNGLFGRKFVTGSPFGLTMSAAIALLTANLRSDRLYFTWPYWRTVIPEIRTRGTAGGAGFTDDGVITVRADGPLASIMSQLPPEEDPGQATGLLGAFFEVDSAGEDLGLDAYAALRAAGICAPRVDEDDGSLYQSGVTTSSDSARTEIMRRNFADFLQDTYARLAGPFSKRLNSQLQRDALTARFDSFLNSLLSPNTPAQARIEAYSLDVQSGNSPERLAAGRFVLIPSVRQFSSLRAIVVQAVSGTTTEITEQ